MWQCANDVAQVRINTKFDVASEISSTNNKLIVEIKEVRQTNCDEFLNTIDMKFTVAVTVHGQTIVLGSDQWGGDAITVGPDWSSEIYRTDRRCGRLWRRFTFCCSGCRKGNQNKDMLSCWGKCPTTLVSREEEYTKQRQDYIVVDEKTQEEVGWKAGAQWDFKFEYPGLGSWETIESIRVEMWDKDMGKRVEKLGKVHLLHTANDGSDQRSHANLDTAAVVGGKGSEGWFPLQAVKNASNIAADRVVRISSTMYVRDPWYALLRTHEWVRAMSVCAAAFLIRNRPVRLPHCFDLT